VGAGLVLATLLACGGFFAAGRLGGDELAGAAVQTLTVERIVEDPARAEVKGTAVVLGARPTPSGTSALRERERVTVTRRDVVTAPAEVRTVTQTLAGGTDVVTVERVVTQERVVSDVRTVTNQRTVVRPVTRTRVVTKQVPVTQTVQVTETVHATQTVVQTVTVTVPVTVTVTTRRKKDDDD
jgi:hypothetical protein